MPPSEFAPPVLEVAAWAAIPGLTHGFLSRRGGDSRGPFAGLNLSFDVGDDPAAVRANWLRAVTVADGGAWVRMRQVHGCRVVRVDSATTEVGEADAMVLGLDGHTLCVLTADCVPILLVAPEAHAVAVVHAGWKGTLARIAEAAVERLQRDFGARPADVRAALGPAIGGCCYEVSAELAERFRSITAVAGGVEWKQGKPHLDLRRINTDLLAHAGVPQSSLSLVGPCTRCHPAEYFSHRGSAGRTGRQLSFIGWRNSTWKD